MNDQSCYTDIGDRKLRYATKKLAKRAARQTGCGTEPYRCPACAWWHIGRPWKSAKQRLAQKNEEN